MIQSLPSGSQQPVSNHLTTDNRASRGRPVVAANAFRPCDDCRDLKSWPVRLTTVESRNAIANVLAQPAGIATSPLALLYGGQEVEADTVVNVRFLKVDGVATLGEESEAAAGDVTLHEQ
jgi:hypothetical protein